MGNRYEQNKTATILICSIRLIGDVILTTPLIDLLHRHYPEASIDLLIAAGSGSFLRQDPRIRNVIEVKSRQIGVKNEESTATFLKQIFRKYDLAINMNASDRGNIATALAGYRERIGFYEDKGALGSFWKRLLLSKALPYDTECHTARVCEMVAGSLGITVDRLKVSIYWNEEDKRVVQRALQEGQQTKPYIVMHPFARWDYKYWPLENFVRLNDQLFETFGLRCVWTSSPSPDELVLLEKYAGLCRHKPVTIPGSLSLNQITCLIADSALYIGLDTAISHLAASTSVPMIALYGPTLTRRWFPWNNEGPIDQFAGCERNRLRNGQIILLQESCINENCIRPDCQNQCLPRIRPEQVFAEAKQLLQEQGFKLLKPDSAGDA
jgi:heptosyltransferase-3